MPRVAFALLCAAVLALLPACGSAGQQGAAASAALTGSSSSSGDDSTSESDTAPATETGGTESAGPAQGGQGSLKVASLPLGANVDAEGCLSIRFQGSASEVPTGMTLVVTGIWFDPEVFTFGGSACPGERSRCQ